jgi:hypothetical protein
MQVIEHERPAAETAERIAPANILRDVVNPWPPVFSSRLLTWNDGTVPRLAKAIYQAKDFGSLPVLADACEESGDAPLELVAHLRSPGPHYRGMWSLDLLLGKE